MNTHFKRNLLIGFSISFTILTISSVASYISIRSLLNSNKMVNHTQDVIYNLNEGAGVMIDAQTGVRGYLLTGRQNFLEQYNGAQAKADAYFDQVKQLTSDNEAQQVILKDLGPVSDTFFNYLQKRVDEKLAGNATDVEDVNKGKNIMSDIRAMVKVMENNEKGLLKERISSSENYGNYTTLLIIFAALISFIISVWYFTRIFSDYKMRAKLLEELEKKDRETASRITLTSNIAGEIARGNYDVRVEHNESDALGSMGESLNNMAMALSRSFKSLSDNEWLQAGVAELNQVMIGEKGPDELTDDIIAYLCGYINSNAGVLYLLQGDHLYKSAGYSYIPNESREVIKIGQGLTGQAVVSGKMLELKSLSEEDIAITYALGEVKPGHIIALPVYDEKIVGVIELASVKPFPPRTITFLKSVANNIGIAIKSSQNRQRIQELLEETQAQSEELRVQHTELENMNAELEAQTSKLQASEEELRVQQEELQQTNEELAERSVLLEERNLEIQKKSEDLELSTRYKSEFLANMSHELRTPLNSILLLSRLLAENNDKNMSPEQVEFATVIQSSGNGLLALIDEILDLSKIEAGKMEIEFLDVSVNEIENNLKNMFGEVARQKNIAFNIDDKDAPLVIKTDKMRLDQILKNLISNALKFTSEGSVTLKINKHAENDKLVQFTVKDTGIGIPREKQPLIFEAFQQADGSTKRKYGGTGLGLSISRELVKLLGGDITLKSEAGKGSEFIVTMPILGHATGHFVVSREQTNITAPHVPVPVHENENTEAQNEFVSQTIPDEVPDDRNEITENDRAILIVEDDVNFAKTLLDYTRKQGYKGIIAVRGDHVLNLALAYLPVGILLDIQLPVKSGWEVMDELKTNKETRHIPVHMMSSHKLKKESLMKGAINFLDKPAAYEQIPEIFKRIEQIVNRESQKVLIIEDNPKHAKALAYFLETHNVNSEIKSEINEGVTALQQGINCVILDMGVPDRQAYEILENVKRNEGLENLPVIVFTGKSLSMKEELKIKKYADSIIVKTAHSYQRMLDEVSLFLHLVEENKKDTGTKEARYSRLNNILKDKTVLVVDDDVRNIYSLTKALELLKMNVLTAIDGKEALAVMEEHPETDVVLLDMMMPNMDGYETATRIRQNYKWKNLPVIAVTAKAMTGDREKCINAGASDYITKPVDVDQLLSLLRVWLYDRG
ncbi:hybrid sensor histidine kinase/response regulator [Flavobacterium rhizosphaerae]|uniref:histidine kinase n=1 Tax=Flavobacterium rhizosphaerae TaxID=3163298 RepID=A0ABW8Z0C5_9FLAO